jgi:uncharacterized membrane protein YgcG
MNFSDAMVMLVSAGVVGVTTALVVRHFRQRARQRAFKQDAHLRNLAMAAEIQRQHAAIWVGGPVPRRRAARPSTSSRRDDVDVGTTYTPVILPDFGDSHSSSSAPSYESTSSHHDNSYFDGGHSGGGGASADYSSPDYGTTDYSSSGGSESGGSSGGSGGD